MELIINNKYIEDNIKDNINTILTNIEHAYQQYLDTPEYTSVNKLKVANYNGIKIIEQNKNNNSSLASFKSLGIDVANIIGDRYYGNVLKDKIYLNINFFIDYGPFHNRDEVRNCMRNIWKLANTNKMVVGGIKLFYIKDKDNNLFLIYWHNTRNHNLVSANKIDRFLLFKNNIA